MLVKTERNFVNISFNVTFLISRIYIIMEKLPLCLFALFEIQFTNWCKSQWLCLVCHIDFVEHMFYLHVGKYNRSFTKKILVSILNYSNTISYDILRIIFFKKTKAVVKCICSTFIAFP